MTSRAEHLRYAGVEDGAAPLGSELVREALDFSLVERALVVTDGTVTTVLEALMGEPIVVRKMRPPCSAPRWALEWLNVERSREIGLRAVLLCGGRTGVPYLYGESIFVRARLPREVRVGLRETDVPLGKLLRSARVESFREAVGVWTESACALAPYFGLRSDEVLIARSYGVQLAGNQRALAITEKFPSGLFPQPTSTQQRASS
jgi:chorismate-pyruvate lyase